MKRIALALLLVALASGARAQSNPGLITGQVPTAAQWNSYFAAKADYPSPAGAPGGANTNVQFNNSGAFGGDAGFTYAGNGQATLALGSLTASATALNVTATWNNGAVTFAPPLSIAVTDTASTTSSTFFSIKEGTRFILQAARGFAGLGFGGLWLGDTPQNGLSNFTIGADSSFTYINSPTGVGGAVAFTMAWNSGSGAFNIDAPVNINRPRFTSARDGSFGWVNSTNAGNNGTAADTAFYRDAVAGVVAFANMLSPTSANTLRVYNTTDAAGTGVAPTNYERAAFDWTTTANTLTIGTQRGGTGVARNVAFVAGTSTITYTAGGGLQIGAPAGGDKGAGTINAAGAVFAPALVSTGTPPTNSGTCAVTAQAGGNTAGVFTASGACAAGTYIFAFATTAPTGWACAASDRTTTADTVQQTASSTTTATFKATTANSDVVSFQCAAY